MKIIKNMKNIQTVLFFVLVVGLSALALDAGAQTEIQQQLGSVSSTLGNVAAQVESVKEKGVAQTIWDNLTAPIAAIWQQVVGIFGQIGSILSVFGK